MRLLIILFFTVIPCLFTHYSSEEEFGKSSASNDLLNPEFLMQVPESGRIEFFRIVGNDRLSQYEKSTLLNNWSQEFNVTSELYEWSEKVKGRKEVVMQNVRAVVANISDVYSQLDLILVNITLTRRDQQLQIDRLAETFPREVRTLYFIARHYRPESSASIFGKEKSFGFPENSWKHDDSSPEDMDFENKLLKNVLPGFLEKMSRNERKVFFIIVRNDKISQYEQNRQLTLWAEQFNITNKLHNWSDQVQKQKDIVLDNVKAVVANISNVYYQLEDILGNTTLTRRAHHSQIDRLAETFPREVRALFFIARHYRPESTEPMFGKETRNGVESQNQMTPFGFPDFKKEDFEFDSQEIYNGNQDDYAQRIDSKPFFRSKYFGREFIRFDQLSDF